MDLADLISLTNMSPAPTAFLGLKIEIIFLILFSCKGSKKIEE